MHHERHDASCQDVILHIGIPGGPESLRNVKVNIIFGNLIELAPERFWGDREQGCGVPDEQEG